ncbi:SprT-like domain-containing protein [Chitinophaga sancti]|uniref:SprT-like domain-containing protein n=1 Tax=Chitinophaga sancti TaxID=1004 RepID=A0A1K1QI45_9BACT|nr:SprT-like domain-containing protein [Chitinophaga sancti]WQD65241.1 SprT-like domain-containing protein [Chitinophaga sancti]WQG89135.1 SprT-like domain-containing protein [Chitinophaga sancti]SFW59624.1 SprT-like family protein [Chitinophaga sancti]
MKQEHPLQALAAYLPEGTFEQVLAYIQEFKVHLTITRERASILGDYRHPDSRGGHRISINGNLNKYAFLITLLHEMAHLTTFNVHSNRVASHGKEWKSQFSNILKQFVGKGYLPPDVEAALRQSIQNPAASSCADDNLMRVLTRYDRRKENHYLVEQLPLDQLFKTKDGRIFRKGEKVRKRYRCEEVATKRMYLFSPVYEVEIIAA